MGLFFEGKRERERRERQGIEDTKREIYKGEPLIALNTIIKRLKEGHFKSRTSRLLKYAAGDIYIAYGEPYEDPDFDNITGADTEKLLDAINIVVSENSREGMLSFANFLSDLGTLAKEMESRAKKSLMPGAQSRARETLIRLLEEEKKAQKAQWPTLGQLMNSLKQGNI